MLFPIFYPLISITKVRSAGRLFFWKVGASVLLIFFFHLFSLSTHVAPAFTRSSLIPVGGEVQVKPRIIPAEIGIHHPWQIWATIFPASCISLVSLRTLGSRLSLSGVNPPDTTRRSKSAAFWVIIKKRIMGFS